MMIEALVAGPLRERLEHIRLHPELHRHTFRELISCAWDQEFLGLNVVVFDAHERYAPVGGNGGKLCDVTAGPCSCGAWH